MDPLVKMLVQDDHLDDYFQVTRDRIRAESIRISDFGDINDILATSNPSDYIVFDLETKKILDDYFKKVINGKDLPDDSIPNDIFIANTIALPDVVFRITIYNDDCSQITSEFYIRCVYNGSDFIIIVSNTGSAKSCAAVRVIQNTDVYSVDDSVIYVNDVHDTKYNNPTYSAAIRLITIGTADYILVAWYALQIMMLNPVLKERLLVKTKKEKIRCNNDAIVGASVSNKKKRKAKYIRFNTINNVVLKSDVVRKQHTMCWYVIGHYRCYSSGKKTWINGYWKGPLRELQKNLDEGRERVLK